MLARIRKQLEEKDNGFTLVELLVVIIIIGILAAIAIPLYLNQQAKARDSALKSDLKTAQIEVASYLVEHPTASTVPLSGVATSPGVTLDANVTIASEAFNFCGTVANGTAAGVNGFCINQDGDLTDKA